MTKSKSTKRALLVSMISLVLCCAMLVGTTFAWFTDSVTSGKNKIVAGNLDVELYSRQYDEETKAYKYVAVDEKTSLFDDDALWEPGHTEVVYLKIANLGTLALKYKLAVTVESETKGTNVNGDTFYLSDYLVFGQVESDDEIEAYETREAAWAVVGSTMGLDNYTKESTLTPDASEYVALVVYMPTTVGNDANYRGDDIPTIELGVTLVATQTPYEEDSFGDDYDESATLDFVPVSDGSALNTALNNGGTVVLTDDTTAQSWTEEGETYTFINVNSESTIDLNGYSLESEYINVYENVTIENGTLVVGTETLWADGATVTLKNVTLTSADDEIAFWGNYNGESYVLDNVTTSEDIVANDVTLTINSGVYNGNVSGADTINGGTFSGDILVTETVTINGGEITGTVTTLGNDWELVINDGEFAKDSLINTLNGGSGDITINGGTFSCTSICESASSASSSWGSLTVTGGTFTEDMIINAVYANGIEISGGNFKSLSLTKGTYHAITISGGTFGSFSAEKNVTDKLTITGGTFGTDPSAYVKDGYEAVSNDDGTWTVK